MNVWFERMVMVCVGLFVCFIFLEVGVRFVVDAQQENVLCAYEFDEVRGWKLKPNLVTESVALTGEYSHFVKTNVRGERGPNIKIFKEDLLILGIGDSMGFGHGVEESETYLRLLEKGLGENVKVLNAGVGGYNTVQAVDTLELYLKSFDVDLVVLGFFAGNDVYGNEQDIFGYDVVDGCLKVRPVEGIGVKHFLRTNFVSYNFFAEKIRAVPLLRDFFMVIGLMSEKRSAPYMLSLESGGLVSSWKATEEQFDRLQGIAEDNNVLVIVVVIPSSFQVSDILLKQSLDAYGVSEEGFVYDYPETMLAGFVEEKPNLVLVFLLEEFRKSKEELFFEIDPHLTKEGHALTAKIIITLLEEKE